ncbi:arsenate reductase (glutaredoxin) [Paucibacter sp. PLA-PC-4]|uniref:arsenate reductase (glutaredoxin) n=1 Tax=Paucibacter sp. PLA-PC-4 TaxID=2993655 RepID=UPI0022492F74|nr:arsenate reductase (glutaredoxin) [Paucibacter sp. PLA-PC-4]MCX2861053.1 arsenate reductase (glutaredoxin) [Paucibacter sp. PLA-PC-4]
MKSPSIYHNPRCSKSREALALLQARGLNPLVIEYLKTPPDVAELQGLVALLGLPARELLRSSEDEYQRLGLADPSLGELDLLAAIAAHPILLQRPIVVQDRRALIARPPELLLGWL